jgi:hypothetical protein
LGVAKCWWVGKIDGHLGTTGRGADFRFEILDLTVGKPETEVVAANVGAVPAGRVVRATWCALP